MSRVVRPTPPHARRARATALAAATLLAVATLSTSTAGPVAAQDLPLCDAARQHDCRLPDWSQAGAPDVDSLFGAVDGVAWVEDAVGDAPAGGIDVRAVGIGRVEVGDAAAIREDPGLLRRGKAKQAVRNGPYVLVRVVLDAPLEVASGHSGVHLATNINGSRTSSAPSGVGQAGNPFAGSQDVYSVTYASTTGKTKLQDSDLVKRWYKDKDPFAAAWAAPDVLDLLINPAEIGADLRVATYVSGADGGYDVVSLGPAAIPLDGSVGLVPSCLESSIATEPYTVRRLVENGETLRGVEAPASWRGGATFPVGGDDRTALASWLAANDDDGDGTAMLTATADLFEDGQVVRQRSDMGLRLDGDQAALWLELGLTRRGFNLVRDITLEPTGDEVADAWLARAVTALTETLPPFRSAKRAGLVTGEDIGACISAFSAPAPVPGTEPDSPPPADEDAAAGA